MVDPNDFEKQQDENEQERSTESTGREWENPDPLDVDALIEAAGDFACIGLGPSDSRELKNKFRGIAGNVTQVVDLENATKGMTMKDKMPRKWRLGIGFGTLIGGPLIARAMFNYNQKNSTIDVDPEKTDNTGNSSSSEERETADSGAGFDTETDDVEDL